MRKEIEKYQRQTEIIFDISFSVGVRWTTLNFEFRAKLMDHVGGSRALSGYVQDWANEFDIMWEALADEDGDKDDYIGAVTLFADDKLEKLCAEIGKQRLTEGRKP